jgi:hypothetical protein
MSQKFEWNDRLYKFKAGTLKVNCRGAIKRFRITDFERHQPTTSVFTTDTYDCYNLAHKQFLDFLVRDNEKDSNR